MIIIQSGSNTCTHATDLFFSDAVVTFGGFEHLLELFFSVHDHHRIFCPGEVGHNLRSHKYTRCSMVVAMRFCIVSGSPLGQICMSLSSFALLWKISYVTYLTLIFKSGPAEISGA